MGTFSIGHWLVILAVVVLLFGAKKIPELAKGVGQGIKDFKKAIKEDGLEMVLGHLAHCTRKLMVIGFSRKGNKSATDLPLFWRRTI